MAVQAVERDFRPLRRAFQEAQRWLWWQRGMLTIARGMCLALGLALAAALLAAWRAPDTVLRGLWGASAAILLIALLLAAALRPSRSQAARVVDSRLGLRQQLGTAEELLDRGTTGRLVSLQLARASDLARDISISRAFPLVPRRELTIALLLAATTAVALVLVALGMTLPNPFSMVRLPTFSREAPSPAEQEMLGIRREADRLGSRSPALEPFRRALDEVRRQSASGSFSPIAAAAALAQANAELNRAANESRIRQEALENLANELRSTAVGREAAESLRQGDYERAAEQLKQIGRESDQLSPAAKRQLAESLSRAAARSQNAQDLARAENSAAQALRRGDYSSVAKAMDELGQSVRNAGNEMVPQSELAEAWQQLEEMSQQSGVLGGLQGQQSLGALSPPVAQSPQRAGERSSSLQQAGSEGSEGNSANPGDLQSMSADRPGGGSGPPGNAPGGPPLGDQNPRLGPDGQPLDVEGQVGDRFPGDGSAGSQPPQVLREGKASSVTSLSEQGASGPISVPAEKVFVPGDRRPIVRDYFSRGPGG